MFFYRANGNGAFGGALINTADGTLTKTGDAYAAVESLARTPLRLATTGGDQNGLAVEAAGTTSPSTTSPTVPWSVDTGSMTLTT